jgi:hypothetical protein
MTTADAVQTPKPRITDPRVRRILDDPEMQERIRQIREDMASGVRRPTISPEDLPAFLREHLGT